MTMIFLILGWTLCVVAHYNRSAGLYLMALVVFLFGIFEYFEGQDE